jgi:hypothetical protein
MEVDAGGGIAAAWAAKDPGATDAVAGSDAAAPDAATPAAAGTAEAAGTSTAATPGATVGEFGVDAAVAGAAPGI